MLNMKPKHRRLSAMIVLGAVSWISASVCATAEPGPKVQTLIDTPTSLLTFGLFRLSELIDDGFGYQGHSGLLPKAYSATAYYDWDRNRIVIRLMDFQGPSANAEEECGQAIAAVRRYGGIDPATGKYVSPLSNSIYADLFMPIGYGSSRLEGIPDALDQIIEIVFQSGMADAVLCTAELVGTGYSVRR